MKNNTANQKNLFTAALAGILMLLTGTAATATNSQDTLIAGEHGNLIVSTVQQTNSSSALSMQHTFSGLATIHLNLRATDSLGNITLTSVKTRGYNGHLLSDDSYQLPAGAHIEVLSATVQFVEYGEHYLLITDGDRVSLTKDGKDNSYARRYELKPVVLVAPGAPESPATPAVHTSGAALTIR